MISAAGESARSAARTSRAFLPPAPPRAADDRPPPTTTPPPATDRRARPDGAAKLTAKSLTKGFALKVKVGAPGKVTITAPSRSA